VPISEPSACPGQPDYSRYDLKPILVEARVAHAERLVEYEDDGTAVCRHPDLARHGRGPELCIPPSRQYPAIRATFDDLNKALSRLSNSPLLDDRGFARHGGRSPQTHVEGARTLRQVYEEEAASYDELAAAAYAEGRWEPDYGTYVIDHVRGDLYLVAPERWHRLALVTSNAMLLTDPQVLLSWQEVRHRLENAVIGFAGVSVGGNILEGWVREARPRRLKIADPDWVESTNFNRGERMSLRHVVASRAARFDAKNPYETPRVSKAEYLAYEQHLVDPHATFYVYKEGLTRTNLDRFLRGGGEEPPIEILVEEMDSLDLKLLVREECRKHGIDVLMLSDFGHRVHMLWNFFRADPHTTIGYSATDEALHETALLAKAGDRKKLFDFITGLCGEGFAGTELQAWIDGTGEQPTSSAPQSGATAMASGAVGGKELALHVLGHHAGAARRAVYDLSSRRATEG
jgi:hypothetical protein